MKLTLYYEDDDYELDDYFQADSCLLVNVVLFIQCCSKDFFLT